MGFRAANEMYRTWAILLSGLQLLLLLQAGEGSLMTGMLRNESSSVQSFTFIVNATVEETQPSTKSIGKFEHSTLGKDMVLARSSIESDSPSIVQVGGNSFAHSAILAYNEHMHLVVRPDDVWLALVTQFAFYVSANAETLRSKFVSFEGKKTLEVTTGGSLHTASYEALALMMTDQIAANIKDPSVRDWVLPNFTTTSNTDRVVGAFGLMATLKEYFQYKFNMLCGLPKVTILGSVDDWRQVRQRAERFVEFDTEQKYMIQWVDMLLPVIDNFILSAEGKPDTLWWNRVVHKSGGGSGPVYVSGWITVFMVFANDGKWQGQESTGANSLARSDPSDWISINTKNIPKGYTSCPLKINDNGKEYDAEIFAGHIVSRLINDSATIVPQLDWSILVKK